MNRWKITLDEHEQLLNVDQLDPDYKLSKTITGDICIIVNIQQDQNPTVYNKLLHVMLKVSEFAYDSVQQLFIPKKWEMTSTEGETNESI